MLISIDGLIYLFLIGWLCNSKSTFVSVFTIKSTKGARARSESPCRLNGEDTEQMYSKHLSV